MYQEQSKVVNISKLILSFLKKNKKFMNVYVTNNTKNVCNVATSIIVVAVFYYFFLLTLHANLHNNISFNLIFPNLAKLQ